MSMSRLRQLREIKEHKTIYILSVLRSRDAQAIIIIMVSKGSTAETMLKVRHSIREVGVENSAFHCPRALAPTKAAA